MVANFGSTSLLSLLLLGACLPLLLKFLLSQLWEPLSVLLLASALGVTLVDCSHSTFASLSVFVSLSRELVLKMKNLALFIGLASECGADMWHMHLLTKPCASSVAC